MIISPSPPPQSAQPTHAQSPMQTTDPTPEDPRVASLKAIFPDFDDAVILSVLESTNDDHDRALDVLLGMNDPSFVPPNPPPAHTPLQFQSAPSSDAQRLSQEELDEQLARRLALEEQHTATTQTWQPQTMEGQTIYQPYQPRRGGRNDWGVQPSGPQQPQGQGGKDTMVEFQEGFNRIAESGKKTFSSIVSKVKAKMQEFDQGSGWSWSQNSPSNQSQPPTAASYPAYYAPAQQQALEQGAYTQPYPSTQPTNSQRSTNQPQPVRSNTYLSSPPRSGVLHPAPAEPPQSVSSQQPSFYDPDTRGYDLYDDEEEIEINDKRTSATATTVTVSATATTQPTVTPPLADSSTSPPPPSDTSSPPSYASRMSSPPSNPGLPSTSPPTRSLSPTITGIRGTTKPGTPGGVDFSKLGLLPKRPVSLVRPQSPPAAEATAAVGTAASLGAPRVAAAPSTDTTDGSTDQEEPEFVENPFEDR